MEFAKYLALTIAAAALFPRMGSSMARGGALSTALIMAMYLCMGMGFSLYRLAAGLKEWRLHLATQAAIFLFSPAVALALYLLVSSFTGKENALGLLFVGCLPTTLTSCAMLTQRSGGNDVGAIYNSLLAQLLGVVLSPLLLSVLLSTQIRYASDLRSVLLDLLIKIVLPMATGQLLFRYAPAFVRRLGSIPKKISFYAVFVILFLNLSSSISKGDFYAKLARLWLPISSTALLSSFLVLTLWALSYLLGFPKGDRICIAYTGSHKTLGLGIPLAIAYFPGDQMLVSNVSLVIITYYLCSLTLSVFVVGRLSARGKPPVGLRRGSRCRGPRS